MHEKGMEKRERGSANYRQHDNSANGGRRAPRVSLRRNDGGFQKEQPS